MRRAYLLIVIPPAIVGILYFIVFRSFGMAIKPAPCLGALGAFVAALLIVRHYQRKPGRGSRRP
jgi:hypothetical protein